MTVLAFVRYRVLIHPDAVRMEIQAGREKFVRNTKFR